MPFTHDATQDCSATNASATALTATFPGGAAPAGRLLFAAAHIATPKTAVTRPSGSTDGLALDMFSASPCLIGVVKIATGGETGMTFSHSQSATGMSVCAAQFTGPLSPLAIDRQANNPADGAFHTNWPTGTTAATVQADEIVFELCGLAGVATAPSADNVTPLLFALQSNELLVAFRTVSAMGTQADTFRWSNGNFAQAGIFTVKAAPVVASSDDGWDTC